MKKVNLVGFDDILLYCSLLLNKSVCHLKLDELDDINSIESIFDPKKVIFLCTKKFLTDPKFLRLFSNL